MIRSHRRHCSLGASLVNTYIHTYVAWPDRRSWCPRNERGPLQCHYILLASRVTDSSFPPSGSLTHFVPRAWSFTMGCIPSKSKVLEADSPAQITVKPKSKKEKKEKRGLESPVIADDAAPWVKGTGRKLSEKDGMIIITDSRPS